ncbi:MAG TPA: guanylate kinase [Pyrinomonadaceae bacterium]
MSEAAETAAAQTEGARGILFVVSSPSGGGKGTLIRRILPEVPGLGYSVSWTTRPARTGEAHGVHYFFVTPAEFLAARARGEFIEWAVVHGNYYATSRPVVEAELAAGRDVILELDVQGAAAVRALALEAVSVFILPPSFEVLRVRLIARKSESLDDLAIRLRNARAEVEHYREFDYVVLNDEVERAAAQLAAIIYAARAERAHQEALARRVLDTFPDPAAAD